MGPIWRSLGAVLLGWLAAADAAALCPQEQQRARASAARIAEEWPAVPGGDELARYIQELGERLARVGAAGRDIPWRFTVLRDRSPYAFAIGAGAVYVTEGAVAFAGSESELAAILAHEIGHQLAGHFCGAAPDAYDSVGRRQDPVGGLVQVIDPHKETEADRYAVGLLREAGFDPRAMREVAKRLPDKPEIAGRRLTALHDLLGRLPPPRRIRESDQFRRLRGRAAGP
ncbi:M48 family metallopeptidase [Candidatus Methylocalor cossyra]|uniref:Peptidase M48 Ste24p n=1 Tax=Candidatus Methylocalor cossyra TaxID=3108543 RepID=A0ABP1C5R6_9GAMM